MAQLHPRSGFRTIVLRNTHSAQSNVSEAIGNYSSSARKVVEMGLGQRDGSRSSAVASRSRTRKRSAVKVEFRGFHARLKCMLFWMLGFSSFQLPVETLNHWEESNSS